MLCMELLIQGICGQAQHDPGHQTPLYTGDRGLDQRQKALIEGLSEHPKNVTHGILHSLALPEYLPSEFAKVLITMCCWCFGGDDVFHRFLYLNSVFPFSHFKEILVATCCGQEGNSCAVWCWLHHLANKVDPKCLAHETC